MSHITLPSNVVNDSPRGRVISTVRHWIDKGALGPGERLPSIQRLAQKLDVSRPTVRAALRDLERDGLIRPGAKNARIIVQPPPPPGRKSTLSNTLCVFSDVNAQIPDYQRQSGWWSYTISSAIEEIVAAGRHALIVQPDRMKVEQIQELLLEKPLGIIMIRGGSISPQGRVMAQEIKRAGIPQVLFGYKNDFAEFDTVASDHDTGAWRLTRWLLARGCKRIQRFHVYSKIGGDRPDWLKARDEGHERAVREAGLEPLPVIEQDLGSGRYASTRELFDHDSRLAASYLIDTCVGPNPADAIMTTSDGLVDTVAGACRLFGRIPGKDILITGYDNYWMDSPARPFEPVPPAATVDKKNRELGRQMVRLLIDRIDGKLPDQPQHRLVEPEMIPIDQDRAPG